MKNDNLKVEILSDGLIKIISDNISQANHVNAEGFLKELARLSGGKVVKEKRKKSHSHSTTKKKFHLSN